MQPTCVEVQNPVRHFRQRFHWDCGLSCVLMVLPAPHREHLLQHFSSVCQQEGILHSTWSIDLCYVLRRYGVLHTYCTSTIGVHAGYKGKPYYDRFLQRDESRIERKFELASACGLRVECRSLCLGALLKHIEEAGPVILLVDASLLVCDICKLNKLNVELRLCLPWASSYIGHYILLCGHDPVKRKVLYRNPGLSDQLCAISYSALDTARQSFGTDQDVIFIHTRSMPSQPTAKETDL